MKACDKCIYKNSMLCELIACEKNIAEVKKDEICVRLQKLRSNAQQDADKPEMYDL